MDVPSESESDLGIHVTDVGPACNILVRPGLYEEEMDSQQSHNAFSAISKRASQVTEIFSGNNRRSWAVCSFGVLYLMYRTGRAMWTFEKSPDLRGMMSRIIFIAILCLIWVLTREKQREVRFGKSVKALKDFSFSSIKDLANKKRKQNQPTKAFRPKFRGGSL
jgi:hypothetical protein